MKTISKNSLLFRVAYPQRAPSKVSLCQLINNFILGVLKHFVKFFGCLVLMLCVIVLGIISVPLGFLLGYRPAFITAFKTRNTLHQKRTPFVEYPLPSIAGMRVLPILPLIMIGFEWLVTHIGLEDIFKPDAADIVRTIGFYLGIVGSVSVVFILLYQLQSFRTVLVYIKTRWYDRVCVTLEVTD